jgi:diphthamide synthase (EF-2-diphthine--ammonia ligase)
MTSRAWMSWSSGKDSAFALHVVRAEHTVDVRALLVTVNTDADRVAMHAVRRGLVEAQARRLDLPVHIVEIP